MSTKWREYGEEVQEEIRGRQVMFPGAGPHWHVLAIVEAIDRLTEAVDRQTETLGVAPWPR